MTNDNNPYEGLPLTIQQVSSITGVHKATLRYWERLFCHYVNPQRTGGNHRLYSSEDVRRVLELKRLMKVDGYTVSGVRRKLNLAELSPESEPAQN